MDELERIELRAILDFFAAAPREVANELDLAVLELDGGAAFSIGAEPKPLLFNRALGLTDHDPLPELERWSRSRDCPLAISVSPDAELERELVRRGYERSRTYMKFRRESRPAHEHTTSLQVSRMDREHAHEFGAVVATVFGVPEPMARWLAALCERESWICVGAFDDNGLVGTGAAYVAGEHAWFGIATTLPQARGRGAQTAILARRIDAARAAGAHLFSVETADRADGEAGPSFRNVVRAGFEEAFRQQWWLRL